VTSGSNGTPTVTVSHGKVNLVFHVEEVVRRLLPGVTAAPPAPLATGRVPAPYHFEIQPARTAALTVEEAAKVGAAMRSAAASALLKMDFRMQEVSRALSRPSDLAPMAAGDAASAAPVWPSGASDRSACRGKR
jgi:hypothetical protein